MALIEPWMAHSYSQDQRGNRRAGHWRDGADEAAAAQANQDSGGGWRCNLPLIQSSTDWTDILVPRGSSVWDMNPSKLRTAAIAFTFVSTAGFVTLMAVGGLLCVMVTGALVTFSVLVMVMASTALIAMVVTGAPVGYALYRLLMSGMIMPRGSGGGGGGGPVGHYDEGHGGFRFPFGGGHAGGYGGMLGGGWHPRGGFGAGHMYSGWGHEHGDDEHE